ncbi:MAG: uroporphyrinogen decarboxylase family protein [Candidatus Latescibacterota bacterium]|jgi:hypothetical protein
MTPRERLLAPFRGVTPDRPCWTADLTYWYTAAIERGRLDPRYQGSEGFKRLHEDLGVCYYYHYGAGVFTSSFDGVETAEQTEGQVRRRWWRTPVGELEERWEYLPQSCCWAHVEYPVRTAAQLKVVQDLFRRTRHTPTPRIYEEAAEFLGELGLPIAAAPRAPLPALMADWCGVMSTIYLLADEPAAVADTLGSIDHANDAAFDCLAAGPAELVHFCDNLDSGNCASLFAGHMEEYYHRRLARLHAAGRFAAVHLDGTVRGLLPKLAACGFDAVESITPAPVGDVEVEDLRTVAAADRTILWGGIPGAMFAAPWTESQVREHTRRLLAAEGNHGRLIVASADQIPPDGRIELCRAIAETIETF